MTGLRNKKSAVADATWLVSFVEHDKDQVDMVPAPGFEPGTY
jgi:hypothetical protein